jgi:hypothetical protein
MAQVVTAEGQNDAILRADANGKIAAAYASANHISALATDRDGRLYAVPAAPGQDGYFAICKIRLPGN